jgi:hypothetical protein
MSDTKPPAGSRYRALPALALLAALLVLNSWPAWAETRDDKTFDDWKVSTVTGQQSNLASTFTVAPKDRASALYVYKVATKCTSTFVSIGYQLNGKADKDIERKDISGELRVDQNPIHSTSSRMAQKSGSDTGYFYVDSFSNPQTLLGEMQNGQTIRFRFKVGDQEWYYSYSLKGFQPSLERVGQLCAQIGSGQERKQPKPGSEGGSKPKPGKSDADFFGDKKPSPPNSSKSDKDFF